MTKRSIETNVKARIWQKEADAHRNLFATRLLPVSDFQSRLRLEGEKRVDSSFGIDCNVLEIRKFQRHIFSRCADSSSLNRHHDSEAMNLKLSIDYHEAIDRIQARACEENNQDSNFKFRSTPMNLKAKCSFPSFDIELIFQIFKTLFRVETPTARAVVRSYRKVVRSYHRSLRDYRKKSYIATKLLIELRLG
jgi:hypothetical protein